MHVRLVFAIGRRMDPTTTVWIVQSGDSPIRGPWRLCAVVSRN